MFLLGCTTSWSSSFEADTSPKAGKWNRQKLLNCFVPPLYPLKPWTSAQCQGCWVNRLARLTGLWHELPVVSSDAKVIKVQSSHLDALKDGRGVAKLLGSVCPFQNGMRCLSPDFLSACSGSHPIVNAKPSKDHFHKHMPDETVRPHSQKTQLLFICTRPGPKCIELYWTIIDGIYHLCLFWKKTVWGMLGPLKNQTRRAWKYATSDSGVHSTSLAYSGCTCSRSGWPQKSAPSCKRVTLLSFPICRKFQQHTSGNFRIIKFMSTFLLNNRFLDMFSRLVAARAQSTSGSNCLAEPSMLSLEQRWRRSCLL